MDYSQLHITIGPMFSGKTSKLIETYNEYKELYNVCVLSYLNDKRYSENDVVSHDKKSIPSTRINNIKEFIDMKLENVDVLLIDEAQFFPDLMLILDLLDKSKIIIHIFGLDADFNRKKFGFILDLIPYCDSVKKLNSKCSQCNNTNGIHSFRTNKNNKQILIGSSDMYIPLCRQCYNLLNK